MSRSVIHYKVCTVSGEVLGIRNSRDEAVTLARSYGLGEDRVFEMRKRDGWIMLGLSVILAGLWIFALVAEAHDNDLVGVFIDVLAAPGAAVFVVFGLPLAALGALVVGLRDLIQSHRASR